MKETNARKIFVRQGTETLLAQKTLKAYYRKKGNDQNMD
jgi:hypothetical protein